jgi:hypothetical protein
VNLSIGKTVKRNFFTRAALNKIHECAEYAYKRSSGGIVTGTPTVIESGLAAWIFDFDDVLLWQCFLS